MKILLLIPPLTQLNTPYPSTAVLKGFLQEQGHEVAHTDLGIELIHKVFSKDFIRQVFLTPPQNATKKLLRIYDEREAYINSIEQVLLFLQGKDNTLATRIINRSLLPEGPRFDETADMEWAFGAVGTDDKARHFATLYLEDLADYIREAVSPHFDLIRYAEHLAISAPSFDNIEQALQAPLDEVDKLILDLFTQQIEETKPELIGFSVPFPGCLYAALRCAQYAKQHFPEIPIVIGGGYPNTELRSLTDTQIFKYTDYILLDDGEIAMQRLCEFLQGKCTKENLIRCYYLDNDKIIYSGNEQENLPFSETGTPDFSGLPLDKYISLTELTNPMHKLWSNGRWNKMTVAHGCYWAKCAFCDCSLDYIRRYDAPSAKVVVDRMEAIMAQTAQSGFHFTDEALPPKLLKEIAHEILERKLTVSFWGNIRFEKSFTADLCYLLSEAGCVAVSGGLEVASDRLLKMMNKGVSLEQATQSCLNFTQAGIMVHTYLMYGFPTETEQETVDALEVVRQMFDEGLIQSAFWHRFTMTAHSPTGLNPEKYNADILPPKEQPSFAENGIEFTDHQLIDLDMLGDALRVATYNYMHGVTLDAPAHEWFEKKLAPAKVKRNFIRRIIKNS